MLVKVRSIIIIIQQYIPYSGLFSRRLYFANSQFNSCSRKVISRMEILNHASSQDFDWPCFREIREI